MSNGNIDLYHATLSDFSVGQVVAAESPSTYYPEAVAALESVRPEDLPSRSTCVFAAASAEAAFQFLSSQPGVVERDIKIYRVGMDLFHRAPFRLMHELHKRVRGGGETSHLIEEYWSPRRSWVLWEYFGPSFEVLESDIKHDPAKVALLGLNYDADIDQSAAI